MGKSSEIENMKNSQLLPNPPMQEHRWEVAAATLFRPCCHFTWSASPPNDPIEATEVVS